MREDDEIIERLRNALRSEYSAEADSQKEINEASRRIEDAVWEDLAKYCKRLVRGAPYLQIEAEDLFVSAWVKALKNLQGENGDRIRNLVHFKRMLYTTVKHIFVDAWRGYREEQGFGRLDDYLAIDSRERFVDTLRAPEEAMHRLEETQFWKLVVEIFREPMVFAQRCRLQTQRHPKQYIAYVVYQIAYFFRNEILSEDIPPQIKDPVRAEALRTLVKAMPLLESHWVQLESVIHQSVENGEIEEATGLFPSIALYTAEIFDVKPLTPTTVHKMRYELFRIARTAIKE